MAKTYFQYKPEPMKYALGAVRAERLFATLEPMSEAEARKQCARLRDMIDAVRPVKKRKVFQRWA